jgi:protein subunit release factor A
VYSHSLVGIEAKALSRFRFIFTTKKQETIMSNEKRILEIRAGAGGEDARLFVAELAQAYLKLAERRA